MADKPFLSATYTCYVEYFGKFGPLVHSRILLEPAQPAFWLTRLFAQLMPSDDLCFGFIFQRVC